MIPLNSTIERFRSELMGTPSPDLLVRVRRLAQLSAAGRVFEANQEHAGQVLRRLILKHSAEFPVTPGLLPAEVLSFVHGEQAIAATLCYLTTRRARYLIREQAEHKFIFRNLKGTEHTLDRDAALALFRGYRMTDVFLMPVPPVLAPPMPTVKAAPAPVVVPVIPPAPSAQPRPAFQARRPSFSGLRQAGKQG
ncbi:hypothetical protein Q0M94_25270 (plasmid) [Deinococcus radiomollis]|uniref:hypothetical protein n=1 Tax=Deinococcus radiomollis TaxID=468916 RepID=UPI0038925612